MVERKFEITEESVEEEISINSGLSGIVLAIGNFEKADANVPYLITNARNIPNTVGNNPTYSGSECLNQLFKKDEEQENFGASAVIALQVGKRERAKTILELEKIKWNVECLTGGLHGNNLNVTLTEGTSSDFLFILTDSNGNKLIEINNKPLDVIFKRINGAKRHINIVEEVDEESTFTEIINQSLTGGSESQEDFNIENLQETLSYLNKTKFNSIIFTEKLDSDLYSVLNEFLMERYAKSKLGIGIFPLNPDDSNLDKFTAISLARGGRMYFINQTINDLNEAQTCARIAGAIAGLNVKDSLSKYVLNDIESIHPVLNENDIEELTEGGIICLELKDQATNTFEVYSSVSSCIKVGDNGKLVPQSELHAVRSSDYCFNKLNEAAEEYLAKTDVKKNKDVLQSVLDKVCDDLTGNIAENLTVKLEIDSENPERLIMDRECTVFRMIEKIHNRDKVIWA